MKNGLKPLAVENLLIETNYSEVRFSIRSIVITTTLRNTTNAIPIAG